MTPSADEQAASEDAARPLPLRHNFSWTLAGNVVFAGCQWLILVLLAKLGSPELVGQYALALAIVTPVISLGNLQLRVLQATDARRDFRFGHYLAVRLLTATAALAIATATAAASGNTAGLVAVVGVLALARSLDSVSDVAYGLMQQRERMDRIARSLMLHGTLHCAAFALALYATGSLLSATAAIAVVSLALLLAYDLPGARSLLAQRTLTATDDHPSGTPRVGPLWHGASMRRIAWLGLPLGLVTAFNSLSGSIPRYFLAEYSGERELGIFAAMFYLTVIGSMLTGALADPASPRLARAAADGDATAFRHLLGRLVFVAIALGCGGLLVAAVAGRPLLTLLYDAEYAGEIGAFLWLMAAAVPAYVASVLGVAVNSMRRFHAQLPLPLLNLLFTTALAAVLIPGYGLTGASQVVLVSSTLSMLTTGVLLLYCMKSTGLLRRTDPRAGAAGNAVDGRQ